MSIVQNLARYEPDYTHPRLRSDAGRFLDESYEWSNDVLSEFIEQRTSGLDEALRLFFAIELDKGFVQDDGRQALYYRVCAEDGQRFFLVQLNARRADRTGGAGRKVMPVGAASKSTVDPGCFLCRQNVRWMQRGVQSYLRRALNGRPWVLLANPFPFGETHVTVASEAHVPQELSLHEPCPGTLHFAELVDDLLQIVTEAPGFFGAFNGVRAGASIPQHLHVHVLARPSALFPLQEAARRAAAPAGDPAAGFVYVSDGGYPLPAFRLRGTREEIGRLALGLARGWREILGPDATENLVAIEEDGQPTLYFVPRDRRFGRAMGFAGELGALEVLGEFVFSTEVEAAQITDGRVNFHSLGRILQQVAPIWKQVDELARRVRGDCLT